MSNTKRDDKIRELLYDLQREKNFDKLYEMIGNFYFSTEVPLDKLKSHVNDRGYKLMSKIIKMGNKLIFKIP